MLVCVVLSLSSCIRFYLCVYVCAGPFGSSVAPDSALQQVSELHAQLEALKEEEQNISYGLNIFNIEHPASKDILALEKVRIHCCYSNKNFFSYNTTQTHNTKQHNKAQTGWGRFTGPAWRQIEQYWYYWWRSLLVQYTVMFRLCLCVCVCRMWITCRRYGRSPSSGRLCGRSGRGVTWPLYRPRPWTTPPRPCSRNSTHSAESSRQAIIPYTTGVNSALVSSEAKLTFTGVSNKQCYSRIVQILYTVT